MMTQQFTHSCISEFSKIQRTLLGDPKNHVPLWLRSIKEDAFNHFSHRGFPSIRHEDWKYAPINAIVNNRYLLTPSPTPQLIEKLRTIIADNIIDNSWINLVFVNGFLVADLSSGNSSIPGLTIASLSDTLKNHYQAQDDPNIPMTRLSHWYQSQPLTALNTAFFRDGAFICLAPNTALETPIQLLFIQSKEGESKTMSFPRNMVHLGSHSQAQVIESHAVIELQNSEFAKSLTDSVSQVWLDEGAKLSYIRSHLSPTHTHQFSTLYANLDKNSQLLSNELTFNTSYTRDYTIIEHIGTGSKSFLSGLFCLGKDCSADHFTMIEHTVPDCESQQLYHGILSNSAQGFFSGKVLVHKNAQRSITKQINKNILLSDNATVWSKPHLEIYANDAICSHKASLEPFDQQKIFYLRTRGINQSAAKNMLVRGFAQEILNKIGSQSLKSYFGKDLNLFLNTYSSEDVA